jgi:hypothetical protein
MIDIIDVLLELVRVLIDVSGTLWRWLIEPVKIFNWTFRPLYGLASVVGVILVAYLVKRITPFL